jgi:hypothetical protein
MKRQMQITVTNKRILGFFGYWGPEDEPIETYVTMSHRMWWRVLKRELKKRWRMRCLNLNQ